MSPGWAGAAYPNALSFARSLVRRMQTERWRIEPVRVALDAEGRGEALLDVTVNGETFRFFVISNVFPADQKVDRSFGINWDVSAALCQGDWTPQREAELRVEIPKQYEGRYDSDVLCFCRGNRSERIFDQVVESLADGRQPDVADIVGVGYILRSTAFAGNGLFGMKPFSALPWDHPLASPYHAQMLAAYLLREFVFELVDSMARSRNANAARLDRRIKRYLGVGNSAGLGLVPFIAAHPHIIHRWRLAYETAYAEAAERAAEPGSNEIADLLQLLERAITYFGQEDRDGNGIFASYELLRRQLGDVRRELADRTNRQGSGASATWREIVDWTERHCHPEVVEILYGLLLELYPDIVSAADAALVADETTTLQPAMSVADLRAIVSRDYGWALPERGEISAETGCFWYYPQEAPYEPRRGVRGIAPAYELETAMDLPKRLAALRERLEREPDDRCVGELAAEDPSLQFVIERVQSLSGCDYAEFRENFLSRDYSPFNACRFLLAFYGMEKYDPRPPRSTKGALLQGAPIADEIASGHQGDWPFPLAPLQDASTTGGSRPSFRTFDAREVPAKSIRSLARDDQAHGGGSFERPVRIFPGELRKLFTKALMASGEALGPSETAVRMVLKAEALAPGALDSAIDDEIHGVGTAHAVLSVLLRALETGCAASCSGSASKAAVAIELPLSRVAPALPVLAAERGIVAALADFSNRRLSIAGPSDRGPWLLLAGLGEPGTDDRDAWLHAQADWLHALLAERSTRRDGMTFFCVPERVAFPSGSSFADMPEGHTEGDARLVRADELATCIRELDADGREITRARFDALTHLAKRALIPEELEAALKLDA